MDNSIFELEEEAIIKPRIEFKDGKFMIAGKETELEFVIHSGMKSRKAYNDIDDKTDKTENSDSFV